MEMKYIKKLIKIIRSEKVDGIDFMNIIAFLFWFVCVVNMVFYSLLYY